MPAAVATPQEYAALTTGCALVDRSGLGKLALTGDDAASVLDGQVTNDIGGLQVGTGCYAVLLTNKGKILADLRVLRLDDELLLLTERSGLQALFDALRRGSIGWQVELHKRTLQQGLLSLIGPGARAVAGVDGRLGAAEHSSCAGPGVTYVATDLGVDIVGDVDTVRGELIERGAIAVGEDAAEVVRIEHGRPRHGIDLDDSVIPQEAGLNERAVSFTKGCYVGQETVARLFYKGRPQRTLRGLLLPSVVETATPLVLGERSVGTVASVAESPRFGVIALALVRREADVGDVLDAGGVPASVVGLPFA